MSRPAYFDYNATTPVDPLVLQAMLPYYEDRFGNAASVTHIYGWEAEAAVKEGRKQVAALLGASPSQIVFTSGATESNNTVFFTLSHMLKRKGAHLITSSIEHKCVLNCCKFLQEMGFRVTYLPVDKEGFVNPEDVERSICEDTILISVMMANNEIGTLQPISEIGQIARSRGILFHTDAAQTAGKIRFNIQEMPVDFLSLSAHKMYGPKGVGALFVKPVHLLQKCPFIQGGGQEKGMRSGTLNIPGIVGFGKACQLAALSLDKEVMRLFKMKKRLYQMLSAEISDLVLNGSLENSLPNTLNVSIPSINSVQLLSHLKARCALSTGSACTSADQEYSHVLKAIGRNEREGKSSLRISFGRFTRESEVEELGVEIIKYVHANQAALSV